ncbi:MAG: hypothetical protein ACRCTI_16365 [Beijerinckiaceae bacterium]
MLFAATALVGLAACDKYVDRRDQVTFGSGDAVAFNKAAQIIDPWPAAARTVTHGMRGEQAEAALTKLRRREAAEEAGGGSPAPAASQLSPAPAVGGQPK